MSSGGVQLNSRADYHLIVPGVLSSGDGGQFACPPAADGAHTNMASHSHAHQSDTGDRLLPHGSRLPPGKFSQPFRPVNLKIALSLHCPSTYAAPQHDITRRSQATQRHRRKCTLSSPTCFMGSGSKLKCADRNQGSKVLWGVLRSSR